MGRDEISHPCHGNVPDKSAESTQRFLRGSSHSPMYIVLHSENLESVKEGEMGRFVEPLKCFFHEGVMRSEERGVTLDLSMISFM